MLSSLEVDGSQDPGVLQEAFKRGLFVGRKAAFAS